MEINEICDNSAMCGEGKIFVAIKGNRLDGNDYMLDAHTRGARVFITEKEHVELSDSIVITVKNARKTLAVLCARLYGNPERRMKIIGITGTKGKSTTGFLLSRILKKFSVDNIFIGTFGIIGEINTQTRNTTPSPPVVFKALADAYKKGIRVALIEVSSQSLKDFRIYNIPFKVTVFTSLGFDHVGKYEHKTRREYISAKHTLFTSYGTKIALVNGDDAYSSFISSGAPMTYKCGFCAHNDIIIKDFTETDFGSSFNIGDTHVKSSLRGKFNSINLTLSMMSASLILKKTIREISPAVSDISVDGRFEEYYINFRHIIIDYAHTPESFSAVSAIARQLYGGRQIAVFGSVSDRAYERRALLAKSAERLFDFSIITGDDLNGEEARGICEEIASHFSRSENRMVIPDRRKAIEAALSISNRGDVVLLLGKGHEKSIVNNGIKEFFSEKEIVLGFKDNLQNIKNV